MVEDCLFVQFAFDFKAVHLLAGWIELNIGDISLLQSFKRPEGGGRVLRQLP